MKFTIYGLLDPDTYILRYVGLTNDARRRKKEHNSAGHYIRTRTSGHYRNWRLHLLKQGKLPVYAIIAEYLTDVAAQAAERAWIKAARDAGLPMVNWEDGGYYSATRNVTWGAKISAAKRGRSRAAQSPESIELTAAAHRGMKRSVEARARMAEAQHRPEVRSKIHTAESRAKRSAAMKRTRALRFWSSKRKQVA